MVVAAPPVIAPSPVLLLRTDEVPHPERAIGRGTLVRVRAGVYAPALEWNALAPWDRYRARVHAVSMVHPDAVFGFESAASLLGLPVFGYPRVVHLLVASSNASREVGGTRSHTSRHDRELVALGGVVLTSRADVAVDIARQRHAAIGLAVADAVLRAEPGLDAHSLSARNEARLSSRGRDLARWSLARADAASESPLESVSRAAIEWLGFVAPRLQAMFGSDRSDFWWPRAGVIGESDGDLKYDGRYGDAVAALRSRRERDARLRRQARSIVHWGWPEVIDHAQLRSILAGAGVPHVLAEHTSALTTMRRQLGAGR